MTNTRPLSEPVTTEDLQAVFQEIIEAERREKLKALKVAGEMTLENTTFRNLAIKAHEILQLARQSDDPQDWARALVALEGILERMR